MEGQRSFEEQQQQLQDTVIELEKQSSDAQASENRATQLVTKMEELSTINESIQTQVADLQQISSEDKQTLSELKLNRHFNAIFP